MPLIADVITRVDELGGKDIRTLKSGSVHHQAIALVDQDGNHVGIQDNPADTYVQSRDDIHGRLTTQRKVEVLGGTFDKWVPSRLFSLSMENAGGGSQNPLIKVSDEGALSLLAGFAIRSKASVRSRFEVPSIPGVGITGEFTIRLQDISAPISGQVVRWGFGDETNGVFLKWIASEANKLRLSYFYDGTEVFVSSDTWDTPVAYTGGSGLLKHDKIQSWIIVYDWLLSRTLIFLDGTLVHDHNPSQTKTLTRMHGGRMIVENEVVTGNANGLLTYVYGMHTAYLGRDSSRFKGLSRFYCAESMNLQQVNTAKDMFSLDFEVSKTNAQSLIIPNTKIARIRRITIKSFIDNQTGLPTVSRRVRILRNNVITGAAAFILNMPGNPQNPDNAWNAITTPVTVAATGTVADGSGYSAGQNVRYRISAIGPDGETLAQATGSANVSVGTPAEVVSVILKKNIPGAVAYGIYREEGAAGTYDLIGFLDPIDAIRVGFLDNAFSADNARQVPSSANIVSDSFMRGRIDPTVVHPTVELTEMDLSLDIHAAGENGVLEFEDGELNLEPGDSLVFRLEANTGTGSIVADNVGLSLRVDWDEE